jgi:hypothetical protein
MKLFDSRPKSLCSRKSQIANRKFPQGCRGAIKSRRVRAIKSGIIR